MMTQAGLRRLVLAVRVAGRGLEGLCSHDALLGRERRDARLLGVSLSLSLSLSLVLAAMFFVLEPRGFFCGVAPRPHFARARGASAPLRRVAARSARSASAGVCEALPRGLSLGRRLSFSEQRALVYHESERECAR